MILYFLLYTLSIVFSIVGGYHIWKTYKNTSGAFFFGFSVLLSLWFAGYFLFFTNFGDERILLFLDRLCFALGVGAMYSLLFFVYYFGKQERLSIQHRYLLGTVFVGLIVVYISSDFIVQGLIYDTNLGVYREIMGPGIWLHTMLHLLSFFGMIGLAIFRYFEMTGLNRIRFRKSAGSAILLVGILLILQLILPISHIWILEKEIIVFFVIFVAYTLFILKRYSFAPIWYDLGKLLSFLIASLVSIIILNLINAYWLTEYTKNQNLWNISDTYRMLDFFLSIAVFFTVYRLVSEYIFGKVFPNSLANGMKKIEKSLTTTMNLEAMNEVLHEGLAGILHIHHAEIVYIPERERADHPVIQFFDNTESPVFINDIAFLDGRHIPKKAEIIASIPKKSLYLLPLYGNKKAIIGFLSLGAKRFGEYYDSIELMALGDIALGASQHLRYIEVYDQLEDISRNLDRKVDEKTLEYNTLISRQRDFISTLSHEVKTPVTSTILQLDNILDDLDHDRIDLGTVRKELLLLSEHLVETGNLLSRLFSIEHMDRQSALLYPETVDITKLIQSQYQLQKKVHTECLWHESIESGLGYISIDKVQITQVLNNILNNAIKFASKTHPEILIETKKEKSHILIAIEDNGKGIKGIDLKDIFEKYTIGNNSVGLGIGLYLCRRIVDLHQGHILATTGKQLPGVRIEIRLPINL